MHKATSLCRFDFVEIAIYTELLCKGVRSFLHLRLRCSRELQNSLSVGTHVTKKVSVSEVRRHGSSNTGVV